VVRRSSEWGCPSGGTVFTARSQRRGREEEAQQATCDSCSVVVTAPGWKHTRLRGPPARNARPSRQKDGLVTSLLRNEVKNADKSAGGTPKGCNAPSVEGQWRHRVATRGSDALRRCVQRPLEGVVFVSRLSSEATFTRRLGQFVCDKWNWYSTHQIPVGKIHIPASGPHHQPSRPLPHHRQAAGRRRRHSRRQTRSALVPCVITARYFYEQSSRGSEHTVFVSHADPLSLQKHIHSTFQLHDHLPQLTAAPHIRV